MALRAQEMPLRSSDHHHRIIQQHGGISRAKSVVKNGASGADAGGAAGAGAQPQQQPQVIECRKKNSRGESVVTHRYLKGRLLGKGGFAHCHKVTCVDSTRVYAMKIVPKSTLIKSRARQKLQTEIKIHRTLDHPRIVHFEKFFEDRENVYILLELCSNHSLSELIRKTKRFTEDEARRYMLQILEATSYLHRHQIIHRDLKLGNVFLDRDWNIKMGDFGLATKLVQDSERKRTICGTPNYIAPEVLEGKAGHSYQVDLWSAGVILYTMLVGRPPYESTDVKSTYRRILANVYAFPEAVPVSDSAKNLVGRLLQVQPELRPSLNEILNHPFLRNGGPPQHFSTAHGLRGSSSSSAAAAGSRSAAADIGRAASLKHSPERCDSAGAGGLGGRPPLQTRSANVEAEGGPNDGDQRASAAVPSKARAPNSGSAAAPDGGSRDVQGRYASSSGWSAGAKRVSTVSRPVATSTATVTTRSSAAMSRNATDKGGITIYCDAKDTPAAGSGGRASSSPTGYAASGRRTSPSLAARARREAAAEAGGPATTVDKENDPRLAVLVGASSRVAVKGPASRRPLMRAASSVEASHARVASGGPPNSGGGDDPKDAATTRKPLLRSASSVAGTTYAQARVSTRRSTASSASSARGSSAGAANGGSAGRMASAASPRARSSSRGSRSPATGRAAAMASTAAASYSPYRSPAARAVGAARTAAAGASTRGASKDGVTPPQPTRRATRASAQHKLEFGSTPGSSRKQHQQQRNVGVVGTSRASTRLARRPLVTGGSAGESRSLPAARPSSPLGAAGKTAATVSARDGATGPPRATPPASKRRPPNGGRDALEVMHDLLSSSFAVIDARDPSAPDVLAGGRRASTTERVATSAVPSLVSDGEAACPLVWVTRYVDYSSKYGLGFLLSDGSAGVYFNDATKIVLEPVGVEFEYMERARRLPPPSSAGAGISEDAGRRGGAAGAAGMEQPPRTRHTLDDFPPELQKKVTLLNHFRGYLHELVKKDDTSSAAAAAAAVAAAQGLGEDRNAGGGMSGHEQVGGGGAGGSLVYLKKWLRTRNAILFHLSDRTVQVVFSDNTEILLSKEARLVTFVDKDGNRETQSLQRVLREQRMDITKRVRYSKELIAQLR